MNMEDDGKLQKVNCEWQKHVYYSNQKAKVSIFVRRTSSSYWKKLSKRTAVPKLNGIEFLSLFGLVQLLIIDDFQMEIKYFWICFFSFQRVVLHTHARARAPKKCEILRQVEI